MYKPKRLDTFILGKFLQLFVGAFFICLFVFVMQFMWRYVDDLVGKGLTAAVLGKFFWYVCISLVPTSLPLAVLLASLITFGNMGENLELLSMKAAGVPLVRIMRPIFLLVLPLTFVVYYFQNNIATDAQKSLRSLLVSIKISQPAVEIPEGVFYSMKNFNLYVEKKNAETGMLYHTIIYKVDQGFDRAQIVLADSARIELTADKMHMRLTLWDGEQFQNLKSDNMNVFKSQGAPYDRETFDYKQLIFDFDSNFNELEASQFADIPQAKDMRELNHYVDSVNHLIDSSAVAYFNGISSAPIYGAKPLSRKDSLAAVRAFEKHPVSFDLLLKKWKADQQNAARQMAVARLQSLSSQYDWQSETVEDQIWYLRRHEVEWHQRITLSLACLLFFFIGAPLGAIIRKGGLGLPTIISVLIFIFYYVINTSGMKMARDGNINMVLGMWISSMILAPAGAYLTFMANRDAMLFNRDVVVERLPQGSDHQSARLGSRLSPRGGRAARSRGLSRQEKIVAATQLFRLVLPTSPRHEGQTPGRQRRSAGRRSQQQHFAADSLRFGRHACALRRRNALAFCKTPHQLGAGRPLSPRIGDLDTSLALPFPFGTRFAAIT